MSAKWFREWYNFIDSNNSIPGPINQKDLENALVIEDNRYKLLEKEDFYLRT